MRLAAALLLLTTAASAAMGEHWRMVFHHDEDKSSLTLSGVRFFTPQRGIAYGYLAEQRREPRPVAVTTSDGGNTWQIEKLPDNALSLFVLNDSLGWMLTEDSLLYTEEAGRSWRKTKKRPKDAIRIHFVDDKRGFAAGLNRTFWRTADGGNSWEKVPEADSVETSKDRTIFGAMDFLDRLGLVSGWSAPRRRTPERLPPWLDPQAAMDRWQVPGTSILLETRDGGSAWKPTVASIFGRVTQIVLSRDGFGFGLLTYDESFKYPSEMILIDLRTGRSLTAYQDERVRVTSLALPKRTWPVYAAGVEPFGLLKSGELPGKVVIMRSDDGKLWVRMPVDYRAVARRVDVTAVDAATAFAVTDTGMILKLDRAETK